MKDDERLARVGPAVKAARKKAKLSQGKTAQRTSMTVDSISRIERGAQRNLHLSTMWDMADAYGTTLDELVGRTPPGRRPD